ncbi:hypothetical protein [Marinobacter sp. X15-166B]|uniref:hypothetical protein n=1 Tax=Marinobacter sp. X15-166B TaxID=1897620 RepID=UPI00085BD213|nr:hypothetical protein [Marinobacter sp. X15-166B]OEY66672.1 hypothetical protein BG841_09555 [Marinobacter sp. X15-166B]
MSEKAGILEAERQYYLEAAGIRLWYARAPLPGAAASAELDFSEPDPLEPPQEETSAPVPPARRPVGQPVSTETARARLQGLMSETAGESPAPANRPQPPSRRPDDEGAPATTEVHTSSASEELAGDQPAAQGPAPAGTRLEAHWGLWVAARHVLISERSADASAALQDELAQNILKALGDAVESTLVLQWPVFNNAQVPGTDNAGLKTLLGDIVEGFGGRPVIALGLWPDRPQAQRQAWFDELVGPLAVDSPHSVAALAGQGSYKRELWLQLKSWQQGQ